MQSPYFENYNPNFQFFFFFHCVLICSNSKYSTLTQCCREGRERMMGVIKGWDTFHIGGGNLMHPMDVGHVYNMEF